MTKALRDTGWFQSVERGAYSHGVHCEMTFEAVQRRDQPWVALASCATLTIIPYCESIAFDVHVVMTLPDGRRRRFVQRETLRNWWFLPGTLWALVSGPSPREVFEQCARNVAARIVQELANAPR